MHELTARRAVILCALPLLLYCLTAVVIGVGLVDDTYIFLRYAAHVGSGLGPVFNPGERVEGFTSPLWLGLLSMAAVTPVSLPTAAMALGAAVGALVVCVVALTGPRWGGMAGAIFLATHPPFVFWAWSGMDTVLAAGLVIGTLVAAQRGHTLLTGFLLALAVLARPDDIWMAPIAAALLVVRLGWRAVLQRSWRLALPGLVIVVPFLFWRHGYYGTWVPNTAVAKAGVPTLMLLSFGGPYVLAQLLLHVPVAAVSFVLQERSTARLDVATKILIAGVAWWLLYVWVVGGDHFPYGRFAIVAVGLASLVIGRIAQPLAATPFRACALGVLFVAANAIWPFTPTGQAARFEVAQARGWAATGQWLAAHASPNQSIATLVAGAIPYYSGLRTYDMLGLTDAHVAREGRICEGAVVGHQRVASDYILAQRPDFIILPSSGVYPTPILAERSAWEGMPRETWCSLIDLMSRPEISATYRYQSMQLPSGGWVEYFLRTSKVP